MKTTFLIILFIINLFTMSCNKFSNQGNEIHTNIEVDTTTYNFSKSYYEENNQNKNSNDNSENIDSISKEEFQWFEINSQ